jgi:OFA family oxalate/formate antiporter-like MFS transporter
LLWGGGVFLASFAGDKLWWLYLSYGVIGGIGLGMGYVVPIAVLVKWFPDRRGFITGLAVAGFGAGALFSAPAAAWLIPHVGLMQTFAYLGVAYGVVAIGAGTFMQNPPDGWKPAGWSPSAAQISQRSDRDYTLGEALRTWQWWAICFLMSINTMSGLSIVTQASPIFQEMGKATVATAAGARVGYLIGYADNAGNDGPLLVQDPSQQFEADLESVRALQQALNQPHACL